jgi:uncharacterized protein GlcG (DUF336 family)
MEDTKVMSRSTIILFLVYISSFWASAASAEALTARKQLALSVAMEIAMEAVVACEQSGYHVAATVVDASGIIKAVAKGDLAPPHTLDSSRGKAYAAVSLGPNFSENTTSAIVTRVANGPAFGPLQHLAGVFLVAGGVVIKSSDEVIGAVGVGGAPGGDKDEVCAQTAVAKITDRLR